MTDPLTMTVLDLDHALGGHARLLLGGGFGLFVKQRHLESSRAKTLLPSNRWPSARTTQDIDLFLRAEVLADGSKTAMYRNALDDLGFVAEESAKWMKFRREVGGHDVIVDLMVGPLEGLEELIDRHNVRVKPKGSSGLHARATEDALGIERSPLPISIAGQRSTGLERRCEVFVPQAFTFALMKLGALRDRINDQDKDEGRHHALDLYRIAAMQTEAEHEVARELAREHADHAVLVEAMRVLDELLVPSTGIGRLRLREHPLCPADASADWLATELRAMLSDR